ncbi:MAG: hypothetical protein ACK5H4_25520 [Lacrimispora sphenoides]
MKKKMMSLALAVVMCVSLCVPAFAAGGVSESIMDSELRGRGYPQVYLNHLSETAKESLYSKPEVIFAGGTITIYNEDSGTFTDYSIPANGIMLRGQIPSGDLSLVWGLSRYSTSGNVLVTYSYDWNNIPDWRWQDPIGVSWDPNYFEMIDNSFYKIDKYDSPFGLGLVQSEEYGYANASRSGVTWYADLALLGDLALYGHGEFLLKPKTSSGSTTFYGHYVHPTITASITMNVLGYGSFGISGGSGYDERGNQRTYSF